MASTIVTKNSSTAGAAPTSSDLVQGELAVNVTDKRIYTENASGTVVELGTNPSVPVTFPDGSASAPSLTNNGDTNTGVYFPAADTVGIATGGTERVRVDSSGNVGVGRSPNYQLDVYRSGTTNATVASANDNVVNILQVSGSSAGVVGTLTSHPLVFTAGNTERMRIDSIGNVGIGVTPSAWSGFTGFQVGALGGLNIGGSIDDSFVGSNVYYNAGFKFARATTATYATMYRQTNGVHSWQVSSATGTAGNAITFTQAMTLDASGNLGIGTSSPSYKLDVQQNTANIIQRLLNTATSTNSVSTQIIAANNGSTSFQIDVDGLGSVFGTGARLGTATNHFVSFMTNATERARIDSSGNLMVGTTSVNFTGSGLTLSSNSGTTKWLVGPYSGAGTQFYVCSSGSTGVYLSSTSSTSWASNSDERLKTDLTPIENASSKVASLRAVTGRYKTDPEGTSRSFLIAQDVQAVLPEAVSSTKLAGSSDDTEYLGVAYTEVIPLLVAAIKEQQAIIEQLQADVAALKGN